ncbi:PAS domain S-box-containing protein [Halovenus aranensis]|jgi:PAS domain S-box-containing protein|uniref:PAS domain S-box-containing protein n=1 Tax=Halovenus aranensis TaxID=890420 RepID=A0A1G8T0R0_9EURY|nr:PAS domain S-box protein [Halovenus aranensis]SDJ35139.1 PAS domain S-box-containing protein [Halovenus aranensis]
MSSDLDRVTEAAVLDNLREPVVVVRADDDIIYANERVCEVTALPADALVGASVTRLREFIDGDFGSFQRSIDRVLHDGVTECRVELSVVLPDAAPVDNAVPAEARVTPFTEGDRVAGALVVFRDIGDRKQAETELRESERRFRTMFESHSAPMLLIDPESGEIIEANAAAAAFYGYSVGTLTEMTIQEMNRMSASEVARERERAKAQDRNHFEFEHELASGEVRTVEVHSTPLDIDGRELLFSIVHDITERKESQHELELFKEAALQTGHSVLITDRQGVIEFVNPAFEEDTGYSSEEAVGRTPAILKSDKQDDSFYSELWETILAGEVWEAELVNRRKSGELYYVEQTIAPITDEEGEITNFVGVQSDITERKLREKRLADLNRILRHNLRNSLTAIEGYARSLMDEVGPDHQHKLSRILAQAESLADTSDKITTVRQSLDNQYDIDSTCNLDTVLSDVVADLTRSYPAASVTVDADPVDLDIDAGTCWSLMAELIDNAITHHDGERPQVTVTVETVEDPSAPVLVHVADDGPGIPEQERTAIEVGPEDPLSHSSGIGLAHVHWLVINYGGDVTISENEPRGTVVTLSLPKAGGGST